MRASRGLKWENKMYKLKRSIEKAVVLFVSALNAMNVVVLRGECRTEIINSN